MKMRTITLSGGPMDGEQVDVPAGAETVPAMTNRAEAGKYQDTNPDEPDPMLMHTYCAKTGEYIGWKLV